MKDCQTEVKMANALMEFEERYDMNTDKKIILPNGGFIEYLNSSWYDIYQIHIDQFSCELTLLDEHHHPRGCIRYSDASEIRACHYDGETPIDKDKWVFTLVKNGTVVI